MTDVQGDTIMCVYLQPGFWVYKWWWRWR